MPRRRRLGRHSLTAFCAAALLVAAPAAAAPGDLDGGFASAGVQTASFMTTFPGQEDSHKVAIDSQGRVVVAATLEGTAQRRPAPRDQRVPADAGRPAGPDVRRRRARHAADHR